MTLCNAYLIKGYLLDKQAPAEVSAAVDAVIASLKDANAPHEVISGPAREEITVSLRQPEAGTPEESAVRKKRGRPPGIIRKHGVDVPGEALASSQFQMDGAN